MIAVIICVIVYIVSTQSQALIHDITANEAKAANKSLIKELEMLQTDALTSARVIAYSNDFVDALLEMDEVRLKEVFDHYGEGLDLITVCDTNGDVIMRMHSDMRGDNVLYQHALSTALVPGHNVSTIERGTVVGLSTRGSATIRDHDGTIIGALVCGHDLSGNTFIDMMKEITGSEVTIFDGDTRLSTTIIDDSGNRAVGTRASDAVVNTVLSGRTDYSQEVILFGSNYYAYYSPLIADGEVLGMLFTGVCIDEALVGQKNMMNTVLAVGIACGVLSILLVFIFNVFSVSKPLKKIGLFAEKISNGDIGVSAATAETIAVRSSDEVGVLARALEHAYDQLRGYVGEIQERMQGLAAGDLTAESTFDFQGDFILIKDSINDHIRNLNHTMSEINGSSTQVSSGAKQVADGAQSLAQGATQQAAAIEELSSSIAEIAERTKANADTANRTSALSGTIKDNAERGSHQMDDMISAVREINDASKSISKIIKTIDDIAFQTNILALNAAVEAARAGQHGKGFAVVAEEVRNLASKSAEAARETGDMIQNSMEKAALGSRIAGETAASLTEIVTGINESTRLVAEIVRASDEQSMGIMQINTGIDQVAQVVQHNSATAEQSAAAAEEMSGQSSLLQQLITQFRLKDEGHMQRTLPPAGNPARKRHAAAGNDGYFADGGDFGKY